LCFAVPLPRKRASLQTCARPVCNMVRDVGAGEIYLGRCCRQSLACWALTIGVLDVEGVLERAGVLDGSRHNVRLTPGRCP
jgi:hypothetical protein